MGLQKWSAVLSVKYSLQLGLRVYLLSWANCQDHASDIYLHSWKALAFADAIQPSVNQRNANLFVDLKRTHSPQSSEATLSSMSP
jgi:hypothetical protein